MAVEPEADVGAIMVLKTEDDDMMSDDESLSRADETSVPETKDARRLEMNSAKKVKERARRGKMADSVRSLRMLVPQCLDEKKVNQSQVLANTVTYVTKMQVQLQNLQREMEMLKSQLSELRPRDSPEPSTSHKTSSSYSTRNSATQASSSGKHRQQQMSSSSKVSSSSPSAQSSISTRHSKYQTGDIQTSATMVGIPQQQRSFRAAPISIIHSPGHSPTAESPNASFPNGSNNTSSPSPHMLSPIGSAASPLAAFVPHFSPSPQTSHHNQHHHGLSQQRRLSIQQQQQQQQLQQQPTSSSIHRHQRPTHQSMAQSSSGRMQESGSVYTPPSPSSTMTASMSQTSTPNSSLSQVGQFTPFFSNVSPRQESIDTLYSSISIRGYRDHVLPGDSVATFQSSPSATTTPTGIHSPIGGPMMSMDDASIGGANSPALVQTPGGNAGMFQQSMSLHPQQQQQQRQEASRLKTTSMSPFGEEKKMFMDDIEEVGSWPLYHAQDSTSSSGMPSALDIPFDSFSTSPSGLTSMMDSTAIGTASAVEYDYTFKPAAEFQDHSMTGYNGGSQFTSGPMASSASHHQHQQQQRLHHQLQQQHQQHAYQHQQQQQQQPQQLQQQHHHQHHHHQQQQQYSTSPHPNQPEQNQHQHQHQPTGSSKVCECGMQPVF